MRVGRSQTMVTLSDVVSVTLRGPATLPLRGSRARQRVAMVTYEYKYNYMYNGTN